MHTPVAKTLLCPIIIGRTDHLAALEHYLTKTRAGDGMTLLLTGEAGIGKSRLLKEAKTLAARLGFTILQGNCFETDRTLPYAPLLDLLHNFCTLYTENEIRRLLHPYATEFIHLFPEWSSRWPEIVPALSGDPDQEKRRLFQTLTRFFGDLALSQGASLVVMLEDLHWCDDSTLEFLLFFARQLATQTILLLLTFRNEETTVALNQFLAALDRTRLAAELRVARLQRTDTRAMITSIFEQPIREEFANKIHDLTEGNPFFIEETLKALVARGDIFYSAGQWERKSIQELQIPRTVQVAVAQRVGQLSAQSQHVLTLAAVAGRRFDFSLLQAITGHDEPHLVALIKELIRAQLVVEESAESFAFRHALTQQAIYTELLQRERKMLHNSIAETIELLYSDAIEPRLADLSFHYSCAGVAAKTYVYGRRAGERATGALRTACSS